MDTMRRAIGNWLDAVSDGRLALPSFQREIVWKQQMIAKFLESIIVYPERPVGVFLVLKTGGNPIFPPRYIDGIAGITGSNCEELLLDGQQRLTALWKSLKNEDDNCRYYVQFDKNFKVQAIKVLTKNSKKDDQYFRFPNKSFEQLLFPVCLLDPQEDSAIVGKWTKKLSTHTPSITGGKIKKINTMIQDTRKIFKKERKQKLPNAYSIPFFELAIGTDRRVAIEIYEALNTNAVKLSHYYLAVAKMEKETSQSLYDIAKELDNQVNDLQGRALESDETGELILKIFCLMNGKPPSGGQYKSLPFDELISDKQTIFDGVEWAVKRLNDLQIWYGRQLPSTIPLRVLPALHQHYADYIGRGSRGDKSKRQRMADKLINRYLWHVFLTKRYTGARVNILLQEDYEALKQCFKSDLAGNCENKIPIFGAEKLKKKEIKRVAWPKSKKILARGILLLCCQEGAKDPISGATLDVDNAGERQLHHIFPKSRALKSNDNKDRLFNPHLALNCLFISKDTNDAFDNHLPGTYLEKIYKPQNDSDEFDEDFVKENLESHGMSDALSQTLIDAKDATLSSQKKIKGAYAKFRDKRAEEVMEKISKLLENGKL